MAASDPVSLPSPADAAIWVWDHDRRRIVRANGAAVRFWGERSLLDLIERDFGPADPATLQFAQLLRAASAGEAVEARLVLTPAGRPRRMAARGSHFALPDGRTGLRVEARPVPTGETRAPDRMREIFDTAPQAMALFAEDGSLLVQNAASAFVFGDRALAGLAARYGARRTARDALRGLLVTGSFSHSAMLNTRSGPRRHRVTMRRMLDPVTGALAALTVFADTGERDEALRLAASLEEDAGASLLSFVQAGVAVYDDALKPLYMSDRARAMLGIRAASAAVPLGGLFPRDRQRIADALLSIRDGRDSVATLELAVQGEDGAARWVRMQVAKGAWQGAGAWIATVTDVTDGQRDALATRRGADGREAALAAIGVGTLTLRADGMIVEAGAAVLDLLGWDVAEGRMLADAFDTEGAQLLDRALRGEGEDDGDAIALARGDGAGRLLLGIGPADRYDRGARTVTLREIESPSGAGLLGSREAVARASHELRTPLNAIMGFTQLMLDDPSPIRSDEYREYLRDIDESGTYMLRLLQDILDLRRIEGDALALESAPIDLGNLARVVAKEVEFAARKRDVTLTLSVEPTLPPVLADMQTMRQALTNIVGNAVKFTAPAGWVRIAAVQRASGAVELEVIDNGAGMTADELAVALEPFGQMADSHSGFGGAGMGVPLAKGFVEANRARFELTSEKGVGTVARIVFPPGRVARVG